jgi:hypothetical protein
MMIMMMIFRHVRPYIAVDSHRLFVGICCLHLQDLILWPEDGDSTLHYNVSNDLSGGIGSTPIT